MNLLRPYSRSSDYRAKIDHPEDLEAARAFYAKVAELDYSQWGMCWVYLKSD